jgi:hypothetical protein
MARASASRRRSGTRPTAGLVMKKPG